MYKKVNSLTLNEEQLEIQSLFLAIATDELENHGKLNLFIRFLYYWSTV